MVLVPTGTQIYERVAAKDLHPPTVLGMLASGRLSGYARFTFADAQAFLLFQEGRLAEALLEEGGRRFFGAEAVAAAFDRLAERDGVMDVYRLSKDLTASIHGLLHGEPLFEGQSLGIVNVKTVLEQVKNRRFTGCLRIYTDERTALILYKEGNPLGFFHDGSQEIETSPDASQSIAKLPGAKLDALATSSEDELMLTDLLRQVELGKLWTEATARQADREARRVKDAAVAKRQRREAAVTVLVQELRQATVSHLGAVGGQMFDKVLADRLGRSALKGWEAVDRDLKEFEKATRLLTGASQTRKLMDDVRDRIDVWMNQTGEIRIQPPNPL